MSYNAVPHFRTFEFVLEPAGAPMRTREIHTAAEQLSGEPLRWNSVNGVLAAYAVGIEARFERIRHGYYQIKA